MLHVFLNSRGISIGRTKKISTVAAVEDEEPLAGTAALKKARAHSPHPQCHFLTKIGVLAYFLCIKVIRCEKHLALILLFRSNWFTVTGKVEKNEIVFLSS